MYKASGIKTTYIVNVILQNKILNFEAFAKKAEISLEFSSILCMIRF